MPMPLPNLDDRTYNDLVQEARTLIPGLDPEWTDYNPTDPGIVLIELLAWLTEMVLYRVNRIPNANYQAFLQLLRDPAWPLTGDLALDKRQTVLALRERYRAVTCDDFVSLVTQVWPNTEAGRPYRALVKRAHCLPQRNLDWSDATTPAPGHISVIVVTKKPDDLSDGLRQDLWTWLDQRRLLTVNHHVVGPTYVSVTITARLFLQADAWDGDGSVTRRATEALRAFFHPCTGGPDGQGWPFGRYVYVSEVYQVLDQVSGVDYVTAVQLTTSDGACRELRAQEDKHLIGIILQANELVQAVVEVTCLTGD